MKFVKNVLIQKNVFNVLIHMSDKAHHVNLLVILDILLMTIMYVKLVHQIVLYVINQDVPNA